MQVDERQQEIVNKVDSYSVEQIKTLLQDIMKPGMAYTPWMMEIIKGKDWAEAEGFTEPEVATDVDYVYAEVFLATGEVFGLESGSVTISETGSRHHTVNDIVVLDDANLYPVFLCELIKVKEARV